jgi:hypothetical protein
MPTLHSTLAAAARAVAESVLDAVRKSSLADLMGESNGAPRRGPGRPRGSSTAKSSPTAAGASAPARKRGGRLARRSPDEIAHMLGHVVALVKKSSVGLRAEDIRKALGLDRREVPRVLKEGLATKKLRAKGQKRGTTYSAA